METFLSGIIASGKEQFIWLLAFAAAFSVLQKIMPCNPGQPLWRKSAITDIAYYFILPIFTRVVRVLLIGAAVAMLFYGQPQEDVVHKLVHGYGPLGRFPIWAQATIIFLASDILLYWTHRWFHSRSLWRWHAIHHSPPQVDWLSTYRFHPINTWLSFTLVDTLMLLIGFSTEAVSTMAAVNMIYSAMVHANLNWTFGPFKYCFASPVFHRWHHTSQREGRDKNFAPTFPLLDIMFGTFYMPDGKLPERFGVPGSDIPETSFIGQMLWPFQNR